MPKARRVGKNTHMVGNLSHGQYKNTNKQIFIETRAVSDIDGLKSKLSQ